MPTPFVHTTRSIASETIHSLALVSTCGILLMVAWAIWFFSKDITTYSVSDAARLEQAQNTVQVSTQRAGRVVAITASLGDTLKIGDLLVQLDTSALDLELDGDARVSQRLTEQLSAIERDQSLLDKKFAEEDKALVDQLKLLRGQHQLQVSNQQIQAEVAERYEQLLQKQQSSELDYLVAKRTYQQLAMQSLAAEADIRAAEDRREQIANEYQLVVSELKQRSADIQRKLVEVETRMRQSTLAAGEQQLRAPIAGSLASLADIREGEVLAAGQQVATIQAEGGIGIQAYFPPAQALGHIRPGQHARVKLDGFSWARYGQLQARVERVASAVQQERILVQLSLQGKVPPQLPLLHDLPARVEIATGTKTPYQLLLQRVGDALSGRPQNSQATAETPP
ncbi:HlyD family secretion protein [Microbulbifer sp. 2205BS26-8]|nr:HlyD family efflux transporter periplasmic adaptor subunit [Microbulbifer sp. 2205BS26-8]MDP5208609.1 HlyD family efflux transporter periplasmic adaptor subunit [Microbulbifer sp. 2205BS26-8]